MKSQPRKPVIQVKTLQMCTNEQLFDILYYKSDKYAKSTLKQVTKILNRRGVYG